MSQPVYQIRTWCMDSQRFTPQTGCPSRVTGPGELNRAIRLLRDMGYSLRDPCLDVERVEEKS